MKTFEELERGDWINLKFGYNKMDFYVKRITPNKIICSAPRWLASASETFSKKDYEEMEATFIASTKMRWYWKYLPFRDKICPFPIPKEIKYRLRSKYNWWCE